MISIKFLKYIFFALVTSVVNIVSYFLVYNYVIDSVLIGNLVAYILSISLSFIFNQKFVYNSNSKQYGKMISLYLGSKVLSYSLDSLVLIILNLFLKKWIIFNKIVSNASTCILNYYLGEKIFRKD